MPSAFSSVILLFYPVILSSGNISLFLFMCIVFKHMYAMYINTREHYYSGRGGFRQVENQKSHKISVNMNKNAPPRPPNFWWTVFNKPTVHRNF